MAADWAKQLPHEMLVCIVKKIIFIEDFVAFGSVCKSWREAASNKQYLRPQIPWLLLTETDGTKQYYYRHICRLSKEDHKLTKICLYIPEMHFKKCMGLNYGWVLTISMEGEMNLLHPLFRSRIQLPHHKSINSVHQVSRAALSANPSDSDQSSGFVVMIIHGGLLSYWRSSLGLGREKQQPWTTMITNQEPGETYSYYSDLTYYRDRFYAIDRTGKVWSCQVTSGNRNVDDLLTLVCTVSSFRSPRDLFGLFEDNRYRDDYFVLFKYETYVVESGGDLIVVVGTQRTSDFHVFKLDLINGSGVYKRILTLDDRAIFVVGDNTSISLDVSEFRGAGLIKSNHIYISDYNMISLGCREGIDSYNLEDGQFTKFEVAELLSQISGIGEFYLRGYRHPFLFIPSL